MYTVSSNKTVIVIGLTAQGLSLLRLLARAGLDVIAYTNTESAVGFHSRYGRKEVFSTVGSLRESIKNLVEKLGYKPLCFITSGGLLAKILSDFTDIYDICDVRSGPLEVVDTLSRKNKMYQLAKARGLVFPAACLLTDYKKGDLKFPVVLKKDFEVELFFKVLWVADQQELERYITKIPSDLQQFICIQEAVDLDNFQQVSYQAYYDKGGAKLEFIGNQKRKTPDGLTSYVEEVQDFPMLRDVTNASRKLLQNLNYIGFVEVEFLYRSNGSELIFMEVNARPCGWFSILPKKFDHLLSVMGLAEGEASRNKKPLTWISLGRDIKLRINNKDLSNLSSLVLSCHDILDIKDIKPFLASLIKS